MNFDGVTDSESFISNVNTGDDPIISVKATLWVALGLHCYSCTLQSFSIGSELPSTHAVYFPRTRYGLDFGHFC